MLYSVKNKVAEDQNIVYNDGINKIFLYTKGKMGGTKELKDLLRYLEDSVADNAVDSELKMLHGNIQRLKSRRNVEEKYMNMREIIEEYAKEWAEEMAEERAKVLAEEKAKVLAEKMAADMLEKMLKEKKEN